MIGVSITLTNVAVLAEYLPPDPANSNFSNEFSTEFF